MLQYSSKIESKNRSIPPEGINRIGIFPGIIDLFKGFRSLWLKRTGYVFVEVREYP